MRNTNKIWLANKDITRFGYTAGKLSTNISNQGDQVSGKQQM